MNLTFLQADFIKHLFDCPDVIGDSRFHCGCDS
jgi:hypothetical protein